jgi:hypothetical protein
MNDFAVAGRDAAANGSVAFEHKGLTAPSGNVSAYRKTDHAGADNDGFDFDDFHCVDGLSEDPGWSATCGIYSTAI